MNIAAEDRLMLYSALNTPESIGELRRVKSMLESDIENTKFNRERAEQLYLFVIDNCLNRYFKSMPVSAARMFPKEIRPPLAAELATEFFMSHGNIQSQRGARSGIASLLFGK